MNASRGASTGLFRRVFTVCFALSFFAMASWSFAMPLLSGPDEATHVIKAAGVIRGQFTGRCPDRPFRGSVPPPCPSSGSEGASTEVHVPAFYALLKPDNNVSSEANLTLECEARHPERSASCLVFPKPSQLVHLARNAWIYDGRYPPLYYVIVGLPTLLGSGTWALYLMRLAGALACSLFVALAASSAFVWSRHRLVLLGVVAAATPMLLYLGGVVNASGLEAAAALSLWVSGSILVLEQREDPPGGLVAVVAVSAVILSLIRSLSPLWLGLCVISLAALAGTSALRSLSRRRDLRLAALATVISVSVALTWTLYEHATNVRAVVLPAPKTPLSTLVAVALRHDHAWIPTLIGVLGSFDTYLPLSTYVIWYVIIGALVLGSLLVASRREGLVLVLLLLAIVFVPPAIVLSHVHSDGFLWNGRDTLPLAVGLPVLAAALIDERLGHRLRRALTRRSAVVLVVLAALAQFGALYEALRRYSVGVHGPFLTFIAHPLWQPPVGLALPLVAYAVVLIVGGTLLIGSLSLPEERAKDAALLDLRV